MLKLSEIPYSSVLADGNMHCSIATNLYPVLTGDNTHGLIAILLSAGSYIDLIFSAILALLALLVHEFAHVFAAKYLGGRLDNIKLSAIGFTTKFSKLETLDAWERYVIYGAGAIANFIAAIWAYSVSYFTYFRIPRLEEFALFCIILCIANLLPVLPLDGGRIFHQFIANRIGILRTNTLMLKLGTCVGIFIMILGLLQMILFNYNIAILCAGFYILKKNKSLAPELQLEFFRALEGKNIPSRARLLPVKKITIISATSIKQALKYLTLDHFTVFAITSDNSNTQILERELLHYIFLYGLQGEIIDVLEEEQIHQSGI